MSHFQSYFDMFAGFAEQYVSVDGDVPVPVDPLANAEPIVLPPAVEPVPEIIDPFMCVGPTLPVDVGVEALPYAVPEVSDPYPPAAPPCQDHSILSSYDRTGTSVIGDENGVYGVLCSDGTSVTF